MNQESLDEPEEESSNSEYSIGSSTTSETVTDLVTEVLTSLTTLLSSFRLYSSMSGYLMKETTEPT